jgi:hypothetical protein
VQKKATALVVSTVFALLTASVAFSADAPPAHPRPRLVVQITIDQLRGDLPLRYQNRFGEGGFRYFLDHGTWYTAAHQPHAFMETVVGHTTLATGAWPSRHGMVGNRWFDRTTRSFVNNIEDPNYPILPMPNTTEVLCDPATVAPKVCKGASPMTIHTTTLSDELTIATAGKAKVFGVSTKDRGAVTMAGHSGKAFWFSTSNGCYVTSTFYYPPEEGYPDWVRNWCAAGTTAAKAKANDYKWGLLHDLSTYLFKSVENVYPSCTPAEINMRMLVDQYHFGRNMIPPVVHTLAPQGGPDLYRGIILTPYADELTLDFAEKLVINEHLGEDDIPDYLAISFSVNDYMGHWFSPTSLESEDNLLRLDVTLRKLIAFINEKVGAGKTLFVLSGDHGGPEYPEYLDTIHVNTGRIAASEILKAANDAVDLKYGAHSGIIMEYAHPYFYLNRELIDARGLDRLAIQRLIVAAVMQIHGIKVAIPADDMSDGGIADGELISRIRRNYDTTRSGDVYVVQEPQWQIDTEPLPACPPPTEKIGKGIPPNLQHDAPWAYDTYVPIAFAGFGAPAIRVPRDVDTTQVAATLSVLLRTKFPSGCIGDPLNEIAGPK